MICKSFNPHTHAGCDSRYPVVTIVPNVSIHTPTQGVTTPTEWGLADSGCFNPHTHAGCDFRLLKNTMVGYCFNPHTHAGCDPPNIKPGYYRRGFNPHTHAGCDLIMRLLQSMFPGFNPHTHAGCDSFKDNKFYFNYVSIHTPTQGVTSLCSLFIN